MLPQPRQQTVSPAKQCSMGWMLAAVLCLASLCPTGQAADSAAKPAGKTKVDPPVNIALRTADGQRISGRLVGYDRRGFDYVNALDRTARVKWSQLKPETVYLVHQRVLPKQSAPAWFELGRLLLKLKDGEADANRAFVRALAIDPSLKDAIKAVKANPDADVSASSPKPPDPSTGKTTSAEPKPPPVPKFKANVKPWKQLDQAATDSVIRQLKVVVDGAAKKLEINVQLRETACVLVYTDLPITELANAAFRADQTYRQLAKTFELDRDQNVFYGKAVVLVLRRKQTYELFEKQVYQIRQPTEPVSLHRHGDGRVVIAAQRIESPGYDDALIRQVTRAFLYRYRSNLRLPVWVEEGLAAHFADAISPRPPVDVQRRARALLEKHGNALGDEFFRAKQLADWQTTLAGALTGFMIKRDAKRYAAFVQGLKAGYTWDVSVEQFYEKKPDDLLADFGRSVGIGPVK